MALKVVGAGLGRTGTLSLKAALEQLLGGPCYHMLEVVTHRDHIPEWHQAARGEPHDFGTVFDGYVAAVDWPMCAFWREIADLYPDAIILLSTRESADAWWKSANETIFETTRRAIAADPERNDPWMAMALDLFELFTPQWSDEASAKEAYERHNAAVRAEASPARLVDYQPGDGWGPLCAALGVPIPDEPFPHTNTTEEFRTNFGLSS